MVNKLVNKKKISFEKLDFALLSLVFFVANKVKSSPKILEKDYLVRQVSKRDIKLEEISTDKRKNFLPSE